MIGEDSTKIDLCTASTVVKRRGVFGTYRRKKKKGGRQEGNEKMTGEKRMQEAERDIFICNLQCW